MVNPDELKYWVSLSRIPGIGRVKISQLKEHFGSLKCAWKAQSSELKEAGLDSSSINRVASLRPRISPDAEMEKLIRYKVEVITCEDSNYPPQLREIYDYPPMLYVRGRLLPQDECCLAVVGTRRATIYGRQVTEEIVADLAQNNVTIVSGLARGIDTAAHRTALEVGGRTLAVFGCGLDIVYPAENAKLARQVMECGALISEYPLGTRPKGENFPRRNRIMSGMSLGVLVIEAGERSGALLTAYHALEQNREVFAIPGSILSPASKGTNHLIQEGAKLVQNCADILEELNVTMIAQQLEMKEFLPADQTESLILNQLTTEPTHVDELCRRSGLPMATLNSTLAMLELKGAVKQLGGMNYVLARGVKEEYHAKEISHS